MTTVKDIFKCLNELAPVERKMDFDNVGILVGRPEKEVGKILTTLDITLETALEAKEKGADVIVSHHPLFFDVKHVRSDDPIGAIILTLVENGISAICMHTNLDVSRGGVNDRLAEALQLKDIELLNIDGTGADGRDYGLGCVGYTESELTLSAFLPFVKSTLSANGLRYVDGGRTVRKVAVCGGSGASELLRALDLGCDTFVTADVKYNPFLDAKAMGINLIDAGHYPTENVVIEPLTEYLREKIPHIEVFITEKHAQPEIFF